MQNVKVKMQNEGGNVRRDLTRQLYRTMLRIRLVEEGIAALYAEQQMRCPVHLCIGQEAVAAGVCHVLGHEDLVLSTHRAHGHYLAKGGDLRAMLAEMHGKSTGCASGMGGSMHLIDLSAGFLGSAPIVGSTIPIAVGVAFGRALRTFAGREVLEPRHGVRHGEKADLQYNASCAAADAVAPAPCQIPLAGNKWNDAPPASIGECVVVAFFGEGATEEGAFHEALNFAALKQLPVLFVCENNLYSVYSPLAVRQPAGREVYRLAEGHGVISRQGDGNDALAVHSLAYDALRHVRAGRGPALLELKTYRWREHCGPNYDNNLGYRTEEEFQRWRALCPLIRLGRRGLDDGSFTQTEIDAWSDEIRAEFAAAVQFAKQSPFPQPESMLPSVYAENDSEVLSHARAA
ncbi:MAG TPA: thiamine pyrophosphate-dependent dehydrogenase E1 component subunit alpha [Pirellulales bacterium]|nr:thiamine pyrophosphate-dependent dehydrogenase E1 component subunit alpha [Pirellulales bacterium]